MVLLDRTVEEFARLDQACHDLRGGGPVYPTHQNEKILTLKHDPNC